MALQRIIFRSGLRNPREEVSTRADDTCRKDTLGMHRYGTTNSYDQRFINGAGHWARSLAMCIRTLGGRPPPYF